MISHQVWACGVTANPVSCALCLFTEQLCDSDADPPWMEPMGLEERFPFDFPGWVPPLLRQPRASALAPWPPGGPA